jgi:hypothetical protein
LTRIAKIGYRLARDAYDPELGFYLKDFKIPERPKSSYGNPHFDPLSDVEDK